MRTIRPTSSWHRTVFIQRVLKLGQMLSEHCITDFDRAMLIYTSEESCLILCFQNQHRNPVRNDNFSTARHNGGSAYLQISAHVVIYAVQSPVTVLGSQVLPDNRTSWNCAGLRLINLHDGTQRSWEKMQSATQAAEQPSQPCWFTQNDALQGVFTASTDVPRAQDAFHFYIVHAGFVCRGSDLQLL